MDDIDAIYIFKSDTIDPGFKNLVYLYNCRIINSDDLYYKVEGNPEDIEAFREAWEIMGWK